MPSERLGFLVKFNQQVTNTTTNATTTQKAVTIATCAYRVAEILDITGNALKMDLTTTRKRKAYDKMQWKKDNTGNWVLTKVTMPEIDIPFIYSSGARGRKIILTQRGKGLDGRKTSTHRKVTITLPMTLTVGQIADAIADLVPATKFGLTANDFLSQFTILGGRTYPLPTAAEAEATTDVDVPETQAEAKTAIAAAEPQKPTKA